MKACYYLHCRSLPLHGNYIKSDTESYMLFWSQVLPLLCIWFYCFYILQQELDFSIVVCTVSLSLIVHEGVCAIQCYLLTLNLTLWATGCHVFHSFLHWKQRDCWGLHPLHLTLMESLHLNQHAARWIVRAHLRPGTCYVLVLMELQHICRTDTQGDKSLLHAWAEMR